MSSIFSIFWNICLLKRGPQHVPTNSLFMLLLIAANLLVSTFLNLRLYDEGTAPGVFAFMFANLATATGIVWVALYLKKMITRFPQTLSAMVGCDLLLTLLVAIVSLFTGDLKGQLTQGVIVLVGIWSVSVWGYILHHALAITVFQGIFFAITILLASIILSGSLGLSTV